MAFFLNQIQTLLPVLGFDFLRETPKPEPVGAPPPAVNPAGLFAAAELGPTSPVFAEDVRRHDTTARGQEINGDFAFSSPSAAAAAVASRSANGRVHWVDAKPGLTYGAWQEAGVNQAFDHTRLPEFARLTAAIMNTAMPKNKSPLTPIKRCGSSY